MIVAGTGHRPQYCPCGYTENHEWLTNLKSRLLHRLTIENDVEAVISGMAVGWDTWLAEVALEANLPVWAYVPFKGQGSGWPTKSQERYRKILDKAEKVLYISENYHKRAFLDRDDAMLRDCDTVYALYNPEVKSGGTYYTYSKALKDRKNIVNFWSGTFDT